MRQADPWVWAIHLRELIRAEIAAAQRLHQLQSADSRVGFEATNHYSYVPLDLVEKVIHCRWLLDDGQ